MSSIDTSIAQSRRLPSRHAMMVFAVVALATILAASAAPTPLYRLYQELWALSPLMLTTIFAVYALSLLVALLTVGSLSDYVGRRPVIFASLALNAVAMCLFIRADSALSLIVARVVQGFATGAATATLGAAILDGDPAQGSLINSVAPFVGLTVGALGSSVLVAYASAPTQLVYFILLAALAAQAAIIWRIPETAKARPGALSSLRPHVAVPRQAQWSFLMVTPVNVAAWALGGFYLSLMPSLLRAATGLGSPLVGGIVVAALTLSAAVAILLWRHWPASRILTTGATALAAGVAVTLAGVRLQLAPVMLIGTVIAGFGLGPSFFGAARSILPLAAPDERAGLLAAFYVQSYLAFSLPAVVVGLLAPHLGLLLSTYIYGAAIIALAAVSLIATLISIRRARRQR